MTFVINVVTLALASFQALSSKYECQAFNTTMTAVTIDDSLEIFSRKVAESLNKPSSSVIRLRHHSPEFVLRIISQTSRKNIEELYLDSNRLTSLPRTLISLSKIESISLADNKITDISNVSVINEFPRLRNLVLSRNPLKSLSGLRIDSLETLEAHHCDIDEIDDILPDSLPALRTLNLTGNPLGTVRKLISESLTKLVLKDCQLFRLNSEAFRGLKNLSYLDLQENMLSSMPDAIFLGNNYLRYLNLGKNRLKSIRNVWFDDKLNLETLDLSKNQIMLIKDTDFAALLALTKLDLAENKVITMPDLETAAFDVNFSKNSIENKRVWDLSKMTRIRRLDLSHNRLEGNCSIFRSTSLGILILGHNKLTTVTNDSIADLPNLTDLNLRGNRIFAGISPSVFQNNPNLVNVELNDNPWSCNCTQLYPMYFYLASGQRTKTTNLICDSPKNASGRTWWEFCSLNWRELLLIEDQAERDTTTWIIAISTAFGCCLIFGTMMYITYTLKKKRPPPSRDVTN